MSTGTGPIRHVVFQHDRDHDGTHRVCIARQGGYFTYRHLDSGRAYVFRQRLERLGWEVRYDFWATGFDVRLIPGGA